MCLEAFHSLLAYSHQHDLRMNLLFSIGPKRPRNSLPEDISRSSLAVLDARNRQSLHGVSSSTEFDRVECDGVWSAMTIVGVPGVLDLTLYRPEARACSGQSCDHPTLRL